MSFKLKKVGNDFPLYIPCVRDRQMCLLMYLEQATMSLQWRRGSRRLPLVTETRNSLL